MLRGFKFVVFSHLQVDPFHTLFGLAGLSLLGSSEVKPVNPVYCLPEETIENLNIRPELLAWGLNALFFSCVHIE